MIILLRFLQSIAKSSHILDRNDVIGLAEDAQHRTIDLRQQIVHRCRSQFIGEPFLTADGAIKNHRSGDVTAFCRNKERLAAGLAYADDADARRIDIGRALEIFHRPGQVLQSAIVREIDSLLAAKNSLSVAVKAPEEIGGQADETGLSEFHG